jgi:hypothetical protein
MEIIQYEEFLSIYDELKLIKSPYIHNTLNGLHSLLDSNIDKTHLIPLDYYENIF